MRFRNLVQDTAAGGLGSGKSSMTERAVSSHRDIMLFTPGQHVVLDGSLLQVVQHLVTNNAALASNGPSLFKIVHIEVAHAPGEDLSRASKLFESREGFLQRKLAAP